MGFSIDFSSFNPDSSKQTQVVIFSRKLKSVTYPLLVFTNANLSSWMSQKHLGILLDSEKVFEEYDKKILSKTNRTIGLLRKLQSLLPSAALITIYKAFVRSDLIYGNVLHDQAFNASFHEKLESIQYNACLVLTGAIRGTSKEKIYQELGLESLQIRRWYRKLCLFYKIYKNQSPSYLYNIIPTTNTHYTFRNSDKIPYFKTKHNFFKNSFFPLVIIEWNKLNPSLRRCDGYNVFKSNILKTIWLLPIRFLIAILLLESNISHEFDLNLVIYKSMNSNITFRIHSILHVTVVMMLI